MYFKNLLKGLVTALTLANIPRAFALDDCEDFEAFMRGEGIQYDVAVERCITNTPGQLSEITMHKLTFTQNIIDKIASFKTIYDISCFDCSYEAGLNWGPFKNLSNLLFLELNNVKEGGSKLGAIPTSFYNFKKLKKLTIINNGLTDVSSMTKFKNLENIDLSYNAITNMDSIAKLKNLVSITLSNNKITFIPTNIGNIKNLDIINLDNNEITNLPSSLSKLTNLWMLDLSNNRINATLPDALNKLPNLAFVNFGGNVNLYGKTLTNDSLSTCIYHSNKKTKYSLCQAKKMSCFGEYDKFNACSKK